MVALRAPAVRESSLATRERLLNALGDLLSSRDTMEFSLVEVGQRAGVNHALVGYHFGGKEGFLLALLERAATTALSALEKLVSADMPGLEKIMLHIRGVIGVYHRHPYINRLIGSLQCGSDANARELARIFINPLREFQAALIAQAQTEGSIRPIDPNFFYFTLIGACDFLFQSRRTLPHVVGVTSIGPEMKDAYADHLIGLILGGMRTA